MKLSTKATALGLLAMMATAAIAPQVAQADSSQTHKNNWRNGAILGGAAALYGLHNHDRTTTILGAGAAAYSANRYEQDRHHQSQRASQRARYYRTHHYRHYRYNH